MSDAPDWAAKLGITDETETYDTVRTSVYVHTVTSTSLRTEGDTVIQIYATTNGHQFDSVTLDRASAKRLVAMIVDAL